MTLRLLNKCKQEEKDFYITSYKTHPELKAGEIWLTNVSVLTDDYFRIGWVSKRLGNRAYTKAGSIADGLRPVFVQASEIEAAP